MSTHCTIGIEYQDGTVLQVYCHSDGYLEYAGRILQTYWNSRELVESLMDEGDLSMLYKTLDESIFYVRDRGEDAGDCYAALFETLSDAQEFAHAFHYVYNVDGDTWMVSINSGKFKLLSEVIEYH